MKSPPPFSSFIPVSQPSLPSYEKYTEEVAGIFDRARLTNGGPENDKLEAQLRFHFGTDNTALFANGSLALEAALTVPQLEGEVITTPFSYVATANAITRCGLTPVFVDVEPDTLTLDPDAVASAITPRTSAILAVHVFGACCRHEDLALLSERHGLSLIYDAAHAFDVKRGDKSIGQLGDVAMFSLHATKPIQAVEGGVLTFKDATLRERFIRFANHGLAPDNPATDDLATNAKMSELHALMGRLTLQRLPEIRKHLNDLASEYQENLTSIPGLSFLIHQNSEVTGRSGFFPILVDQQEFGCGRDQLHKELLEFGVGSRPYFSPLISSMPAFETFPSFDLSNAMRAESSILCLPFHMGLDRSDVRRIADVIAFISMRVR